jgi:hypothetical protein
MTSFDLRNNVFIFTSTAFKSGLADYKSVQGAMNILLVHRVSSGCNRGSHCLLSSVYEELSTGAHKNAVTTD